MIINWIHSLGQAILSNYTADLLISWHIFNCNIDRSGRWTLNLLFKCFRKYSLQQTTFLSILSPLFWASQIAATTTTRSRGAFNSSHTALHKLIMKCSGVNAWLNILLSIDKTCIDLTLWLNMLLVELGLALLLLQSLFLSCEEVTDTSSDEQLMYTSSLPNNHFLH